MEMMTKLLTVGAFAAAVSAGTAQAATYGTIPGAGQTNEALAALGLGSSLDGYYDADLYLIGEDVTVQATVLGYEAGYLNTFTFGSFNYTSAGGTAFPVGGIASTLQVLSSGLLPFLLKTNIGTAGTGDDLTVTNGTNNPNTPGLANFFVSFLPNATATFGQSVLVFFDDTGAGDDDNHDDLVVRFDVSGGSIAPVPVPAAGFLLLGALSGLVAMRRRKTA